MLRNIYRQLFLLVMFISCLLGFNVVYADPNDSSIKVKWSYIGNEGPERWAQLNPRFALCANGKAQSPINIPKNIINAEHTLIFRYQSAPMVIVINGVTELTMGNTETLVTEGQGVQVNFPNTKEEMMLDGNHYRLVQFHIHTPSENKWHNGAFPMEIHFVHQGDEGRVAIIGVFVQAGDKNEVLQQIIDHLPAESGEVSSFRGESINPLDLIPAKHDYYYYSGSLTVPPCTEGVEWAIMAGTMTASPGQIVALRRAANGANARPVQPLHGRQVSYSTVAM